MLNEKCPYCKKSYVEEELKEDAMGFEYVERHLKCDCQTCNFEPCNVEDLFCGICEE